MILKTRYCFSLYFAVLFCFPAMAQVQVSEEPMHRPVFQNKYIRLLDVWVKPGDTTQYHIHSTPSLFVFLSDNAVSSQVKGDEWLRDQFVTGVVWYRSFSPDILIHRVCNLDTASLHINDIEILSSYHPENLSHNRLLPFPVLCENEKAIAWKLKNPEFKKQIIEARGPMLAVLVKGDVLSFHDLKTNQSKEIKAGKFLYIDPGASFYSNKDGTGTVTLVLFEIK